MENHKNPVIPKSCRLLGDLSEKELQEALLYFSATQKSYRRGDFLYSAGMPVSRFGIVLAGTVQVFMENIDGERMVMASVSAGESFGESLAFLGVKESPIWAEAQRDTSVLWLSPDRLRAPSEGAGEALRTLNDSLALRGEEKGGFTTIDLLRLDLFTGKGAIYKLGAAPTYVRRGDKVSRLSGQSLHCCLYI